MYNIYNIVNIILSDLLDYVLDKRYLEYMKEGFFLGLFIYFIFNINIWVGNKYGEFYSALTVIAFATIIGFVYISMMWAVRQTLYLRKRA